MENTENYVDEGKVVSSCNNEKDDATLEKNEGVNLTSENFNEQPVSESESEKMLTKQITHQFSNTRFFNENPVLCKTISHVYSADSSDYPQFIHTPSYILDANGNVVGNTGLSGPSVISKQVDLLNELKQNMSRNASFRDGITPFSRTPSCDLGPMSKEFTIIRNMSNTSTADINSNFDNTNYFPNDMMRNDSLNLPDQKMMEEKKRPFVDDNHSGNKMIRQNTQQAYVPYYPPDEVPSGIPAFMISPNNPIAFHPYESTNGVNDQSESNSSSNMEESGKRKVITANVDGREYQSEIKKKDKRDPQKWTKEEDQLLQEAVKRYGEKNWKEIASGIPGRNHVQCLQRWKKVLKPGLKKGHWTEEEDELLRTWKNKCSNWAEMAEHIPGRTPKQCRERWCNHIDPTIRKGNWTEEEDTIILNLQKQWGNRWSNIAQQLPGRSENAVKIRWKSLNRARKNDVR